MPGKTSAPRAKVRRAPTRRTTANGATRAAAPSTNGAASDWNQRRALDTVMQLMGIPGRSGFEKLVGDFIVAALRKAGAPANAIRIDDVHRRTPIGGDVGNVILKLPGTVRGPRRLLMAHMDTVPICVGSKPTIKGNRVYSADPATGLGGDDRAGTAAILCAALEILERGLPHPPLTFFWPVQEEVGLYGARYVKLSALGKPRLAFNWDGGSPSKLTIGATGGYRTTVDIRGVASHAGGAPEEGVSAIAIASLAIADLVENRWHGLIRKGNSCGTSNVGVIQGGEATNVVTDRVRLRVEARSHDPAFRLKIIRAIEKAFRKAAKSVRNVQGKCGEVRFDGQLDYEAFRLDPHEACVGIAADAVRSFGLEPELAIANGGLDANWMTAHGLPTVSLGCGQRLIHTVNEELDLPMYYQACRIALAIATGSAA